MVADVAEYGAVHDWMRCSIMDRTTGVLITVEAMESCSRISGGLKQCPDSSYFIFISNVR
jgi:hypothetical protein